jgi:adenylosuccinate synthase
MTSRRTKVKAYAVIGANYGDEGKGVITDYLCDRYDADLVVRFNGGAQAGHTVVTPSGDRHVFHHFGSGTFAGAATLLSHFFLVNPLLFVKEAELLRQRSSHVLIDENALVTTPFDMVINQLLERSRGEKRHGSCGVGINETVDRSTTFPLYVKDLTDVNKLQQDLETIRDVWWPLRKAQLGLSDVGQEIIENPMLVADFLDATKRMLDLAIICKESSVIDGSRLVIFEGAQGLLLDEENKEEFPHVTRSRTGLVNVMQLMEDTKIDELHPVYVTRAYLTRHGAGPLPHQLKKLPYPDVKDETNITHEFQGSLRFAYPVIDKIVKSIKADLLPFNDHDAKSRLIKIANDGRQALFDHKGIPFQAMYQSPKEIASLNLLPINIIPELAVTCLDQVGDDVSVIHQERHAEVYPNDPKKIKLPKDGFVLEIARSLMIDKVYASYGPTRDTVREISQSWTKTPLFIIN